MTRIPLADFLGGGAAVAPAPKRMKLEDFLAGGDSSLSAPSTPASPPISVPFVNQPTIDPLGDMLRTGGDLPYTPAAPPVQGLPEVQGVLDDWNLSGYVDPELTNPPSFELPKSALTPTAISDFNERKRAEEQQAAEQERLATEQAFAPSDDQSWERMQRRAKYYETLPYKITADIQSDPEMFERYRRLNELATGAPLLDTPAENREAAQQAISATVADMRANGIDDPVRYMTEMESFDGPQGFAARNASAAWEATKRTGANVFDALIDLPGNDTLGTRQRQMEAGWQEAVEDVKDERSLPMLPESWRNPANEVARATSQAAPQLTAAAGVGYATRNPALVWATLLGPSGVENFQVGRANGMSNEAAAGRAVALAGVEYATAKLGGKIAGSFGGKTFEELAFGTGGKATQRGMLGKLIEAGGGSVIEGGEEVAAGVAQQLTDHLVGLEEELVGDETPEELALAFAVGFVASMGMHAPNFANFIANPTAENAKAAGITEELAPTQVDRESLAAAAQARIDALSTEAPQSPADALPPDTTSEPEVAAEVAQETAQEPELAVEQAQPVQTDSYNSRKPRPEEPPVAPGMVRFYHGGMEQGGKRWFSQYRDYAEGYQSKGPDGKGLYYIDLPVDHPLLKKAYDDSGTNMPAPYQNFEAPAEIARQAKLLTPPSGEYSPPTEPPRKRRLGDRKVEAVEPSQTLRRTASWVIRDKATGEVVLETFQKSVVDKINKDKYEAVPIQEYLGSLNRPPSEQPTPSVAPAKPLSRMEQKARENIEKENDLIRQGKKRDIPGATDGQAWVRNTWRARRPEGVNTPAEAAQWIESGGYGIAPYWKYLQREGITLEQAFEREANIATASPSVAPPDAPPVAPSQVTADSGVGRETGYFNGDQIEYTGVITPDGMREFVYLEGAKKGQTGVRWTEAERNARSEQNQRDWKERQDEFKRLREAGNQIVDANKMVMPDVSRLQESSVQTQKQADGTYKLAYTGTRNEVFPGERFNSAWEARNYFKATRQKQRDAAAIQNPATPAQVEVVAPKKKLGQKKAEPAEVQEEVPAKKEKATPKKPELKINDDDTYDLSSYPPETLIKIARIYKGGPKNYTSLTHQQQLQNSAVDELAKRGLKNYTEGPPEAEEAFKAFDSARNERENAEQSLADLKRQRDELERKLIVEEARKRGIPSGRGEHGLSAAKQYANKRFESKEAAKKRPELLNIDSDIQTAKGIIAGLKDTETAAERNYYVEAGKGFPKIPVGQYRMVVDGRGGLTVGEYDESRGKYKVEYESGLDGYISPQPLIDNYITKEEFAAIQEIEGRAGVLAREKRASAEAAKRAEKEREDAERTAGIRKKVRSYRKAKVASTSTKADIVLDATDLNLDKDTKTEFLSSEGGKRIKEIAKAAPEFAYEPIFTVNDKKQLVFKDGVTYKLDPVMFNLAPGELKEGQTVGINIEDLGIKPLTAEEVVVQSLKNWGFGNVRSDKKGGVTGSWGGAKVQLSGSGDKWTVAGDPSLNSVKNAKFAIKKIHWLDESAQESVAPVEAPTPKKTIGRKKAATAELKGAAQNASLPALKPVTRNQPKTAAGKKLLDKLRADEGKNRVGLRSINDYLMELAHTKLFIGNTQTSKRNPAHYLGKVNSKGRPTGYGPHIVRSRTGYSHINVHEVGHAISGYLGSLDPRWHKSIAGDLIKLTRMKGSVASANTPEEGWAELVRRYVILPNSVPKNLYGEFEKTMGKYNPEMLAGLQDAQAAYAYHRSRPVMDQLQSLMHDKGREKGIGGVIKDQLYRLMFSTIGGDVVLHRINRRGWRGIGGDNALTGYDPTGLVSRGRSMIDEAYRERQKLADGFYKQIKDTPADMESAYQSWLHVPEESGRAIIGDRNGREGIRIRATGKGLDMLDEESVDKLREAGFYIPDANAKHGDWIYLNDKSFDSIKSAVGKDNWQAFETWGQMRAALDRYKKAGHDYPLKGDGLTPELLEQFVKEHQAANPDWDKHFRDVNSYMDQLLLVPVLSGEISVGEAIAIKTKWSDYWPLPRQVEGKSGKAGGGGAEPSAGIRSAYGSLLPFRSLTEAVETRVKSAMESYYTNRMMLAVKNYGDMLDAFSKNTLDPEAKSKEDKKPLASFDARKEAMQLMLPLKMEMKVAAKLTVREQQEIVAKAMNEMAAKELGVPVSELDEEAAVQPEDVVISTPGKAVWRSKKPNAAHVVRVFENGSAKYYQVPDPLLFDFFAHGQKSPNAYFRTLGILLRGLVAPWKRAITQSIPFALNNAIARDPFTAASLSKAETKKALLPGYFMAVGVANRLTGSNLDAVSQSELLSRSLDQTSSKPHLTRWENFKEMLTEGIVPPNYSDMPWYDKVAAAPGQVMSTVLKPADVFNYVTAGRALSKLGEEATREGAYITALREGASDERAQLAYDQITGNFGQRGGNPEVAEAIRSAGFLNPALQILWGSAQHPTHYNPAMRTRYIVAKMPAIASLSAVAAAVNVLLIKAMHDEDDAKEIFAQMQERKDEDRLSKMSVMGMIGLPFDYGHVGAVQSYAWNAVEGWMLDDPVDPTVRAKELLHRATTMPGVADTIPPHVKLWIELGAGETGHSFFYNDDIVPAWLVDKYKNNPELRAYPETPTAYKKIGEWLGVSPMKVRYAVMSGLSREVDAAITTAERPNKNVSDIIVAGRMVTKESTGFNSDSVQSLMDLDYQYAQLKEQAENTTDPAKKASIDEKLASMEATHAGAVLVDKVWKAAKEMRENGDTVGYKKAKRVMVGMGRDILGAPPLEGFPDPWRNWSEMPPEIQEAITKYVTLRAEESLKGRGYPTKQEDETDSEFSARVKAWEEKRIRSTEWLKAHKSSPAVQAAVKEVAKDIPKPPKYTGKPDRKLGAKRKEWAEKYGSAAGLLELLK